MINITHRVLCIEEVKAHIMPLVLDSVIIETVILVFIKFNDHKVIDLKTLS